MNSSTRATLLDQLRDGTDPLAWDEFFGRYWPLIYTYARGRGCSNHTAEEVVQDVMLKLFEQRDIFRYDPVRGRFRDWLGRVVRNQVAEYRRRPSQRIRPRGGDAFADTVEPQIDDAPDETWEAAFEMALLTALLDVVRRETNPRDYLAFELTSLGELPAAEVARITGLTRNMVYKARRRIVRRLRQLGGSYPDDGQLNEQVQRAMRLRPDPAAERSLTTRIEKTICSQSPT